MALNIKNRDEFQTFIPSIAPTYTTRRKIVAVRAVRYSPDEEYEQLKKEGKQIDISNPEYMVNNRKTIDGIFSPLFGPDSSHDPQAYTCPCRKTMGASKQGQICPHCGKEVKEISIDLSRRGHIDIAPYHILTYHGYVAMSKIIKNLDELLSTTKKIDARGKLIPDENYTIMDLYDKYDEVFYPLTGLEKKYAFMSKIPVSSAKLRPLIQKGISVTILDENKHLLSIVTLRGFLKTLSALSIPANIQIQKLLNQIQKDFLAICAITKTNNAGKTGDFRRFLASGRIDNSSRMVISLGPDLKPYEIDIPYSTMMVLYEERIINRLTKIEGLSVAAALQQYDMALSRSLEYQDPQFVNIINGMLREGNGIWALINRNPTINESGILYMRVRKINESIGDMTMHLPPDVLKPLGADFWSIHWSPIGSNPSKEKLCERLTSGVRLKKAC